MADWFPLPGVRSINGQTGDITDVVTLFPGTGTVVNRVVRFLGTGAQVGASTVTASTAGAINGTTLTVSSAAAINNLRITAATRPAGAQVGVQLFDTGLNKPIWSVGGDVWVDASGAIV